MNERITFSVTVYPKKSKSKTKKEANLYMRITMNGNRTEISLDRKIGADATHQKECV